MTIWLIILMVTIAATGIGLVYLTSRVYKFAFIEKAAGNNKAHRITLSALIVAAAFTAAALILNLMNAVVCLLHFAVIWFLCDLLSAVIAHFRQRAFKHYYAGAAAVILSLTALYAGWYLNHQIWATRYTIESEKSIDNLRIVQFADSHIGTTFDGNGFAAHIAQMQRQNPDIVIIAGDFVDDGTSREEMIAAARALGNLKTTYGVYFAFGNHDKGYYNPAIRGFTGSDLIAELKKNNVKVLEDQTELINNMFYIIGRKDQSESMRGGSRAEMKELIKNLDPSKFTIVIDHQPNDYQNQTAAEVDLVLSGHTHGGQLFPLNKVGEWIGANDKTYGFETRNLTNFIVTSGLSDWAIKFKTGTKSEFVIIDIKGKTAAD